MLRPIKKYLNSNSWKTSGNVIRPGWPSGLRQQQFQIQVGILTGYEWMNEYLFLLSERTLLWMRNYDKMLKGSVEPLCRGFNLNLNWEIGYKFLNFFAVKRDLLRLMLLGHLFHSLTPSLTSICLKNVKLLYAYYST